ncbi:MAG TPA: ABC transporter permease [Thermoanaerobaculia bacterium]|nr:ABC transporter permease [Thermoanaerobaculia bacterium]
MANDSWGTRALENLGADLRFAFRTLAKNPSFTLMVVLTLALGIGANTAIFSVVDGVLFRPLPYADPDRLVFLWPEGSFPRGGLELLRERNRVYERLSAVSLPLEVSLTGRGEPERLVGVEATPDLFSTLGVGAVVGRPLEEGEEGTGRDRVVVLSYRLWQRRFGADPGVVGSLVTVDGVDRTVVGVMPRGFNFPARETDVWIPSVLAPDDIVRHWGYIWLRPVGRLRPGATVGQARAELAALVPEVRSAFPWHMPADWAVSTDAVPLRDALVGNVRPMLLVLLGSVGLVLLVACVNVGNLMLTRAALRQKEVAVRAALGAGRGRLVRQLLTESLLLALLGGGAGLLLAALGIPVLSSVLPADMPRLDEVRIDARVLGFTLALAGLTGLGFGLAPALRVFRPDVHRELREGEGAGTNRRRLRLVSGLVAAEVALAVILVIGAVLLVQSLWRLLQVDPGFREEQIVAATVAPPELRYADDVRRRLFYQELARRLEALPGVSTVALGSGVPFGGGGYGSVFLIEGRPEPGTAGAADWPYADSRVMVSPEYFKALEIPLLQGRGFTGSDDASAPKVVLVSRELAETYWKDEPVIGRRIRFPGPGEPWWTVVGVVGDVKWSRLDAEKGSGLYLPLLQGPTGPMRVVVRSAAEPNRVAAGLRDVVADLDPDTPLSDVRTMEELIAASVAESRAIMLLLGAFAAVALALGAVGIYGVVASAVAQRTREIGIRMALGAQTGTVLRLVLWQGGVLAALGIALGLPGAWGATRVLQSLLFEVSATDPLTFAIVPLLLAAVALLASYVPARRAARVNPTQAIRGE